MCIGENRRLWCLGQRRVGWQGVLQTPCHHDHGQAWPPSVKIHFQGRIEFDNGISIGENRRPWCLGAAAGRVDPKEFAKLLNTMTMARLDPQAWKYTSRAEVNFTTVLALAKIDALGAWGQRRVGWQGVCQTPCHHDHGQARPPNMKIHLQGRSEFDNAQCKILDFLFLFRLLLAKSSMNSWLNREIH